MNEGAKPLIVVGMSGSIDYLKDETGDRRFWSMSASPEMPAPTENLCDGIHDEDAPTHYLCTRCFPDLASQARGGDLQVPNDDDYDEFRRDGHQEVG